MDAEAGRAQGGEEPSQMNDADADVANEARRVHSQMVNSSVEDVILIDKLRKVYPGGKVAVKGLSYGVQLGEVWGFLGINGAGKSSTLAMLTGAALPTSGTAQLAGYDVIQQQPEVRRLLGYCPQFDALLELLTVREHLELYARIKGVPKDDVAATVETQLDDFDLRPYSNKLAGTLSGGNKRKLSVAACLIGNPPIVILDEPSTGMDPVARRAMWKVISRVATERKQCSIILTSHSMEEVEALCTRIGIMVGGRLRCVGSAQHLKAVHGQGYVSQMRMAAPSIVAIDDIIRAIEGVAGSRLELPLSELESLCHRLGRGQRRADELSPTGSGWALVAAAQASANNSVLTREFALWLAEEDMFESITDFVCVRSFPGSRLVERQGVQLTFAIPGVNEQGAHISLANMFRTLEGARQLGVATYTLGQTTLEQIFNFFAAQQEEETGVARGMGGGGAQDWRGASTASAAGR